MIVRPLLPVAGLAVLLAAAPASAIVMNSTQGDAAALALGADSKLDAVVELVATHGGYTYTCTGALISETAVLTARHCVDDLPAESFSVNFYSESSFADFSVGATDITTMTPDAGDPEDYFNGTDMAIISLDTAVTEVDAYEVLTFDPTTEAQQEMVITGYGLYLDEDTGEVSTSADSQRRAATNQYDAVANNGDTFPVPNESYEFVSTDGGTDTNTMLYMDFDDGGFAANAIGSDLSSAYLDPLQYEGTIQGGDSGSPLLTLYEGAYVIAGVLTGYYTYGSRFGDATVMAYTGLFSDEAVDMILAAGGNFAELSTVPLPASSLLLLSGFGAILLHRRRRAA